MTVGNRLLAALLVLAVSHWPAIACGPERLDRAVITAVTDDGAIRLAGGESLGLAGLDAAEVAAALATILSFGDRIAFGALDVRLDRWNRMPSLVFLLPDGNEPIFLQGLLLRQGKARLRPAGLPGDCAALLAAEEAKGRAARAGHFAGAAAALPAGTRPSDGSALAGRFIVIEGRLRRLGEGRRQLFLDFSGRRDEGFLVTVDKRLERRFREAGLDLRRLPGATLRVRGVTDARDAARLRLTEPVQIERLGR
jgi:hypothetical protein